MFAYHKLPARRLALCVLYFKIICPRTVVSTRCLLVGLLKSLIGHITNILLWVIRYKEREKENVTVARFNSLLERDILTSLLPPNHIPNSKKISV